MYGNGLAGFGATVTDPSWTQQDADEWSAWVANMGGPVLMTVTASEIEANAGTPNAFPPGTTPGHYVVFALTEPDLPGNVVFGTERFWPVTMPRRDIEADVYSYVQQYRSAKGSDGLSPTHMYAGSPWADPDYFPQLIMTRVDEVLAGVPINTYLPDPGEFTDTPAPAWEPPEPEYDPSTVPERYIVDSLIYEFPPGHGPPTPEEIAAGIGVVGDTYSTPPVTTGGSIDPDVTVDTDNGSVSLQLSPIAWAALAGVAYLLFIPGKRRR